MMERLLAIDTTGKTAGAAVVCAAGLLGNVQMAGKFAHAETLLPMIDGLLASLGLAPGDISAIACSEGPGSFTGARIGAAAAKGLAMGAGLMIVPVPTLAALAYNVAGGGFVCPMIDARRRQVYSGLYRYEGGLPVAVGAVGCKIVDDALAEAAAAGGPVMFTGDGAALYEGLILGRADFTVAPVHLREQNAAAVGALGLAIWAAGGAVSAEAFAPYYALKAQAEAELEKRMLNVEC